MGQAGGLVSCGMTLWERHSGKQLETGTACMQNNPGFSTKTAAKQEVGKASGTFGCAAESQFF